MLIYTERNTLIKNVFMKVQQILLVNITEMLINTEICKMNYANVDQGVFSDKQCQQLQNRISVPNTVLYWILLLFRIQMYQV